MSEQEQDEIIKKLREQVVKIDTKKPSKPNQVNEEEVIVKAKEAGETIVDDDTVSPRDI
jgi:hypothetical protein